MFTHEYEKFSKKFLRRILHHVPNIKQTPDPDLWGFFDWIYTELFELKKENIFLYNGFFKHPVNPEVIDNFKKLSEDELIIKYFRKDSKYNETIRSLVHSMKKMLARLNRFKRMTCKKSVKEWRQRKVLIHFIYCFYLHPIIIMTNLKK